MSPALLQCVGLNRASNQIPLNVHCTVVSMCLHVLNVVLIDFVDVCMFRMRVVEACVVEARVVEAARGDIRREQHADGRARTREGDAHRAVGAHALVDLKAGQRGRDLRERGDAQVPHTRVEAADEVLAEDRQPKSLTDVYAFAETFERLNGGQRGLDLFDPLEVAVSVLRAGSGWLTLARAAPERAPPKA